MPKFKLTNAIKNSIPHLEAYQISNSRRIWEGDLGPGFGLSGVRMVSLTTHYLNNVSPPSPQEEQGTEGLRAPTGARMPQYTHV